MTTPSVWIIGGGKIGLEYASILEYSGVNFKIFTRSARDGLDLWADHVEIVNFLEVGVGDRSLPTHVIIATNVSSLLPMTKLMLASGVRKVLVEKPMALSWRLLTDFHDLARIQHPESNVAVAFNRRFYGFNPQLRQHLVDQGGCTEVQICFGEPLDLIFHSLKPDTITRYWIEINTIHLFDYVLWLVCSESDRKIELLECTYDLWNSKYENYTFFRGTIRVGDTLIRYQTDWRSDDRWSAKLYTTGTHIGLNPLESPSVSSNFSKEKTAALELSGFDVKFKPGFYEQTVAFLKDETDILGSVSDAIEVLKLISQMRGESV